MQYGYRMGKAALHIAGVTLARDFKKVGIPVGLIHPGVVSQASKGNVSWSMQVNLARNSLCHVGEYAKVCNHAEGTCVTRSCTLDVYHQLCCCSGEHRDVQYFASGQKHPHGEARGEHIDS